MTLGLPVRLSRQVVERHDESYEIYKAIGSDTYHILCCGADGISDSSAGGSECLWIAINASGTDYKGHSAGKGGGGSRFSGGNHAHSVCSAHCGNHGKRRGTQTDAGAVMCDFSGIDHIDYGSYGKGITKHSPQKKSEGRGVN